LDRATGHGAAVLPRSRAVSGLDDAAGDAAPGVAAGLRREVVLPGVDDDGPPDDRRRPAQLEVGIGVLVAGGPVGVGFAVAEGAGVALLGGGVRRAVRGPGRVEVVAGGGGVGRAAVAVLVDVEAVHPFAEAADLGGDEDALG